MTLPLWIELVAYTIIAVLLVEFILRDKGMFKHIDEEMKRLKDAENKFRTTN